MKVDIRWQLLLAAICAGLVLAILGFQVQTTGRCTTRVPATGGLLTEGMVGRPQYLNPLLSDPNPVDEYLVDLIFDGLTRYDAGGRLVPALAADWQFGEGGRTVTFNLRDDARWHDGQPVLAADVAFSYGLLQQPAFPAPPRVKRLWQSVVISQTGDLQVTFSLPQPYSPFMDGTTRGILPAHILQDEPPQGLADHPFSQAPIGTGPFMVASGSDWRRTGSLRLSPNPLYWRQGVGLDGIEFRFFQDGQSLSDAYAAGEVRAISQIPNRDFRTMAILEDLRLFSSGAQRYSELIFNLADEGAAALEAVSVRQALAYGLDRDRLVDTFLEGQGLPLDGPYLPTTWAYDSTLLSRFGYEPERARGLLDEAGWTVAAGEATRRKADGTALRLRFLASDDPLHAALAEGIAEEWSRVGVGTDITLADDETFRSTLAQRQFDIALIDVNPGRDPDLYDFWSQEAIIRGQNYGAWNNRRASEALETARQLTTVDERLPYYQAFLKFYDQDLPALTLYQHVQSYGIAAEINRVEIGPILSARDRYQTLGDWFLVFREMPVECPGEAAAG